MGHAVYHRTASGEAQLEDVSSLEAAVELVERLRNEDGPTDVRLFKEIPVEVRTYYRVVVGDESAAGSGEQATEEATEVVVPEASEFAPADDASTEGSNDGTAGDGGADDVEPAVAVDEAPGAESSRTPTEPPAGAMPLLSPPPPVTVHADDTDGEPAGATSGRPKLFNRG